MDANTKRRRRKITFDGRRIEVYKPTEGQLTIVGIAVSGGGARGSDARRLFQVMSALCVDPADWEHIENGLIEGTMELADIERLVTQQLGHEWGPDPKPTKAARAARKTAAAVEPQLDEAEEDEDEAEDEEG
jgi:hypothetical protein